MLIPVLNHQFRVDLVALHVGHNKTFGAGDISWISSSCTKVGSIVLGCNRVSAVGISVFVCLPIE